MKIVRTYETHMLQRKCIVDHGTAVEAPLPPPILSVIRLGGVASDNFWYFQKLTNQYSWPLYTGIDQACGYFLLEQMSATLRKPVNRNRKESTVSYPLLEQLLPFRIDNSTMIINYI